MVDPSKVRTNSTRWVSSTEVVANITIASNATIAYWDVQVRTGGKTGVGTELFEVTTATPILSDGGNSGATAVNDQGDIVGGFAPGAFVVSGTDGVVSDLGPRGAQGISADGLTVVGGIASEVMNGVPWAAVWTRPPGGAWPPAGTHLPDPLGVASPSSRANGIATVAAEGVTVITGSIDGPYGIAAYWQSANGTWSAPAQRLPLPAAFPRGGAEAIAATTGDIAGELVDGSGALVPAGWRRVSGSYVVDVLPLPSGYSSGLGHGISPDGTIIVGNVRAAVKGKQVLAPSAWTRNATNGSYTVTLLPTLSGTYADDGKAWGVTVVGTQVRVVGTSPSPLDSFTHAVLWTWTAGTVGPISVRDIGGLGKKRTVTPYAINASGTVAVGQDGTGADGTAAVKWRLP